MSLCRTTARNGPGAQLQTTAPQHVAQPPRLKPEGYQTSIESFVGRQLQRLVERQIVSMRDAVSKYVNRAVEGRLPFRVVA
jgi:hypothetical protein